MSFFPSFPPPSSLFNVETLKTNSPSLPLRLLLTPTANPGSAALSPPAADAASYHPRLNIRLVWKT